MEIWGNLLELLMSFGHIFHPLEEIFWNKDLQILKKPRNPEIINLLRMILVLVILPPIFMWSCLLRYLTTTLSLAIDVWEFSSNSYIWWYNSAISKGTSGYKLVNYHIFEICELLQIYISYKMSFTSGVRTVFYRISISA